MHAEQLKEELNKIGIPWERYSLNGDLVFDSIVLYKNYMIWEVFYYDERGVRIDEKTFDSETSACEYILKLFKDTLQLQIKFGIKLI
ncbi:MAG: hypothetical protein ACTHJ0_09945 [Flavipsychrobacter sp.]